MSEPLVGAGNRRTPTVKIRRNPLLCFISMIPKFFFFEIVNCCTYSSNDYFVVKYLYFRVYSPTPNPDGIRFAPSRPILRPAQLTSWVAGGYWSPPDTKLPPAGETHSRSSSQSSGFVSTGILLYKVLSFFFCL